MTLDLELILDEPARPRTETLPYVSPPSRLVTVPAASDCSPDEIRDMAAGAARHADQLMQLQSSPSHIQVVCQLLVDSETEHAAEVIQLQRTLAVQQATSAALLLQVERLRSLWESE